MSTLINPTPQSQASGASRKHHPSAILHTASQAPRILALSSKHNRTTSSSSSLTTTTTAKPNILPPPLSALISLPLTLLTPESHELWTAHEEIVLACLQTGDEGSARKAVDALTRRFGAENERVMALTGLCDEIAAGNEEAKLRKVLEGYERVLNGRPENLPIRKRKIALLKSMGKTQRAIEELVALLDIYAVDSEAWAELAETYVEQGCYGQAIFCLEEVLLIAPNAWNIHARLGEVQYMSAKATSSSNNNDKNSDSGLLMTISDAMRRFGRSVELCDDYLRGFYGLKITTSHILDIYERSPNLESLSLSLSLSLSSSSSSSSPPHAGGAGGAGAVVSTTNDVLASSSSQSPQPPLPPPAKKTVQALNELSTAKLAEIVRRSAASAGAAGGREKGWEGYDEGEVKAARELLDSGR